MSERVRILSVTIDDCDVTTFKSGGPGGQNQNKRDTGVLIVHRASGARGQARDERSQLQNKKLAWKRMFNDPKFQLWLRIETGRAAVNQPELPAMNIPESDLKVEVRRNGQWVSESPTAS